MLVVIIMNMEEMDMPWCPVCKNEYKEGILRCADCNVDLVEELSEETKSIYFGEMEQLQAINAFLKENGVESGNITRDEGENVHELSVLESDVKRAIRILGIFLKEEEKEKEKGLKTEQQEREQKQTESSSTVYVDKKYKAEEYKTSAYTLLIVGILGIAVLICMGLGLLPFVQLSASTKVMMYIVLGVLFVVFIGFGVHSLRAYKKILAEGAEEEAEIKKVEEHLNTCLTKEVIKASLPEGTEENTDSEALYFEITEIIEKEIEEAFPKLEDALVAKLTEDYYTKLYE